MSRLLQPAAYTWEIRGISERTRPPKLHRHCPSQILVRADV